VAVKKDKGRNYFKKGARRQKEEDCEFEASQCYIMSLKSFWAM
jgi:hypothetical protein